MSLPRRVLIGMAAAALALSATACGSSGTKTSAGSGTSGGGSTTVKLMVGGLDKQIYLPAMLSQRLGYFQAAGLNVQLSDEPAGVDAENQMLAGNVDGVVGFYDHNIDLQAKGKQTESVVQLLQAPGEVEMVRTDEAGQIKSAADFKGKHLGVTGLGSSTNFLTKALAVHAGVPVNQITSVPVEAGPTFIAAMQHHQIDAGMTTEPTITALIQKHLAQPLIDMRTAQGARQALGGTYPSSCLYLRTDWVSTHKDTVQKLVNAFVKTLKWINAHSAAEVAGKMPAAYYTGVGMDAYVKALQNEKGMYSPDGLMPADGPKTVLNVLSGFSPDVRGHQVDLSKTYTNTFVQQAGQ
ncbi:ABC transporter substrate-binding protein [Actinoallomurus purpureus]|uniref:ABC transporter substrate-binding protein n=1 Tax=Actinoallomurus purpureus TaxID=478114 RepID=UPI002092FB78|nr:ABC transporter substrate-binding protein [Actinoallomurus purpureus]MCO6005950.1 ABC transporter substrate-binding protein [Actinoallomurus purpureus]